MALLKGTLLRGSISPRVPLIETLKLGKHPSGSISGDSQTTGDNPKRRQPTCSRVQQCDPKIEHTRSFWFRKVDLIRPYRRLLTGWFTGLTERQARLGEELQSTVAIGWLTKL